MFVPVLIISADMFFPCNAKLQTDGIWIKFDVNFDEGWVD